MKLTPIRWALIGLVVAAVVAGAAAVRSFMVPPAELDLSRSKPSEQGIYMVAVAPEKEPLRQGELHAWVLALTMPDGTPVEDAKITIDGGMPQHGHGLPTSPQATSYLGEGRYRIEGVRFNMSGWWELKFVISGAPGDDRVTFNLVL